MNDASLEDLNGRLQNKVTFKSFRPNIVVSGSQAFAEVPFLTHKIYGYLMINLYYFHVHKFITLCRFSHTVVYDFLYKFCTYMYYNHVVFYDAIIDRTVGKKYELVKQTRCISECWTRVPGE